MTSLRRRLFALLVAATGAIWLSAVIWIAFGSRAELEHVLDTRLQEAARMVHSMVASGDMAATAAGSAIQETGYARQLSCQIWSLDGRLVARSSGAPDQNLAQDEEGFAEREVNGETWRVYTIVDAKKAVRVAVGDRIGLRDRLVRDLLAGLLVPMVLVAPLLAVLIWLVLGRGLYPLTAVAKEIVRRDGEDMHPVSLSATPIEIRPLIDALNGLFSRVDKSRRHEREITAFAAHELRTPLAGLKTQAQIALAAPETPTREAALKQIIVSVDRTSRLVRQLLALARLEAAPPPLKAESCVAGTVLRDVVALVPERAGITTDIDPELDSLDVPGDRDDLHLVLRNLHENAVEHLEAPGRIAWRALPDRTGIVIEDDGQGVCEADLPYLTHRFYRGARKSLLGTGLGLAIADAAARRMKADLVLSNRSDAPGLRAVLSWRKC